MDEITIKVRNKKEEELLLSLAKRLKLTVKKRARPRRKNGAAAMKWMNELAKTGGINLPDPVAWQRSIRKDRTL